MRALTPQELRVLEISSDPCMHELTVEQQDLVMQLSQIGLIRIDYMTEDQEWFVAYTTERGELALRIAKRVLALV